VSDGLVVRTVNR